ncbi:MAG: DUF3429 domain-containing protein [Pseudomonadota bacterium]
MTDPDSLPQQARWLGYAGLVPFFGLAFATHVPAFTAAGAAAFVTYSAIIVSFLGGIRWGVFAAAAAPSLVDPWIAIVVSLAAWSALLLPPELQIPALAAVHLAVLGVDQLRPPAGQGEWLQELRLLLSLGAITGHGIAWFATKALT